MSKNKLGQYFTRNEKLKEKVHEFILNEPSVILEPCIGQGDLILYIISKIPNIEFDMYEIDSTIKLLEGIRKDNIIYNDFLKEDFVKKYKTIIGNPPYIRTKNGNLYVDFIKKCYNLLEDNGELIFIVPSDFFKLTCCSKILNTMIQNGTFTHIFHPHDEKMFDNACIDIIIFRYCRNKILEKKVLYNDKLMHIINTDGFIIFQKKLYNDNILFKNIFDIYVGIVSGKDEVFKNQELGNIEILNGKKKLEKYIYIEKYPCENDRINKYLLDNKDKLIKRKIKKFNEKNWFQWGALRNMKSIASNIGKECIYIHNLTRKQNVSFLANVNYFGGGLIIMIPKTKCNLINIVSYINSDEFKNNFIFSGRFKIGHRQISNSYIPKEYL